MLSLEEILYLWFDGQFDRDVSLVEKSKQWFDVNRKVDRILRRRLLAYTTLASEEALSEWKGSAKGSLALVLLLDRLTRICYRGTALAYSNDLKARHLALSAMDKGLDWQLVVIERVFLLFPLIASEKLNHQLIAKERLLDYVLVADAEEKDVITNLIELINRNALVLRKFSRFPHRAKLLGHGLTKEEQEFASNYNWQDWL